MERSRYREVESFIELPSSPRPGEDAVQGEGGPRGDHQLPAPPRHPATPGHGGVQRRRQGLCRYRYNVEIDIDMVDIDIDMVDIDIDMVDIASPPPRPATPTQTRSDAGDTDSEITVVFI